MTHRLGLSLLVTAALVSGPLLAQAPAPRPATSQTPQQAAPIDLTGYWVAVVTEDWRWRMITAPKGDFASLPLNEEGRRVANVWDPSEDGSCKAYGAANLMRMPERLHITWASPQVLKIETDWGQQTRMLYFNSNDLPAQSASLQGSSLASWELPEPVNFNPNGGRPQPTPPGGDLKVVTNHLSAAWLRRNGVPYSDKTVVTEYFQTFTDSVGKTWFDVTTRVVDPTYLTHPFLTSSDFRREPDGSKWEPHPCKP